MKKIIILLALFYFLTPAIVISKPDLIVSKDGSGDFTAIQAAIDAAPDHPEKLFIIYIKNGIYNEKLFITKNNLALAGENRDSTIIIFAELRKNWREDHPDDYGSGVVNIKNKVTDIIFHSLTIHNNYGSLSGDNDHQFAIRAGEGVTRITINNCKVVSDGGDAVALWNKNDGMYYHNQCYFEGYVDYVCPRGYCFIENSKFFGHNLTASIWHDGSGSEEQKFVIKNSYFDGVKGFPLGRFHRDAQFFLIDCTFSKNMADKRIFFAPSDPLRILSWGENRIYFYNCRGEGKDYSWHKDNLVFDPGTITAEWIFNKKWDPKVQLSLLYQNL